MRLFLMLTSGTRLAQYEILHPLGAGGMGEVYKARDTRLQRDVVKVLPPGSADDLVRIHLFEQKALRIGLQPTKHPDHPRCRPTAAQTNAATIEPEPEPIDRLNPQVPAQASTYAAARQGDETPDLRMELAAVSALRKNHDAALQWLSRAYDSGNRHYGLLERDPNFAPPPASEPGLLTYIMVDSVAATLDVIVASGGQIVQPIGVDAPEITARFRDPGGNVIGLYQQPATSRP